MTLVMTQAEAEPGARDPRSDTALSKKAQEHRRRKDAQGFSTAGRELTDDELDDIVGGVQTLADAL